MNNFSYEKASIEMLIDFGKSDIVESLASIDKVKHLGKLSYLNRKGRKFWKEVSTYLTREDLQALIKAITVLETQLQWSGGSVAAVIWLYEIYNQSETDKNRELADWILSRTRNPYLPFGCNNFGARSYHEFLRSQETWEERKRLRHKQIEQEQNEAIRRKEERRQRHIMRQKEQTERSTTRREYIEWLGTLDISQQLEIIAKDLSTALDYYPEQFAYTDETILAQLSPGIREAMLARLKDRRRGPWRKTYKALLKVQQRLNE